MKVLCVHGIGKHDPRDLSWQDAWKAAVTRALGGQAVEFSFCMTDELFVQRPLTAWQTLEAIATLGGNAIFGSAQRGLFDGDNVVGWTAGMVLQWAGNPVLREAARAALLSELKQFKPDVIIAHSLGSLIAYDVFSSFEGRKSADGHTLLTLGSQINSRFVSGIFDAGVVPLPGSARWLHIFNPNDHVFTAQIHFEGATNFRQVITSPFGSGLTGGHTDLTAYLNDSKVLSDIWAPIMSDPAPDIGIPVVAGVATRALSVAGEISAKASPSRRALLIGINEYENPDNRLEGCVNDVYEVSALIQECGFSPDDIRVVFDRRATADGIRERLSWLFEGAQDGDVRFLFYSGHGLQMPVYGKDGVPARIVEAMVAADYDGSLKNCITDQDLSSLYGKLPRGCQVVIALDCCYAGGLTRNGGPRTRGIDPPDDIRHRMLEWNPEEGMWQLRPMKKLIPGAETAAGSEQYRTGVSGQSGCVARIGSTIDHRRLPDAEYDKLRKATGWQGPFLPLIITACREDQKSSEYLHGATSYGAFTFAFCRSIRRLRKEADSLTYQQAVDEAGKTLTHLGYHQSPGLTGPDALKNSPIPFFTSLAAEKKARAKAPPRATKKARRRSS